MKINNNFNIVYMYILHSYVGNNHACMVVCRKVMFDNHS